MKNKIIYLTGLLAFSIFLGGCTQLAKTPPPAVQPEVSPPAATESGASQEGVIKATFYCPDGKSIAAEFDNTSDQVNLTLSDGRVWTLPRAMSGSGARYANADETEVFWNKGDTAFIEENGQTTYSDCATDSN